jgi:hypothetical protein
MTWSESTSRRSALDLLADMRAQRLFATRIERAFRPDLTAIARVRSTVLAPGSALAPVPTPVPAEAEAPRARRTMVRARRALPVAVALTVVVGVGLATGFARPAEPRFAIRLTTDGGMVPPIGVAGRSTADLDRSAARLGEAMAAVRRGDPAGVAIVLAAYRADLSQVDADLHRPGADLVVAALRLRSQAHDLATMAGAMPPESEPLFRQVSADLDRMIAALPGGTGDPGTSNGPAPAGPPAPASDPSPGGNGNGNPGGSGNGNPAGNPHPGGTGNPHPGGTGNPHPGGTGNPHPGATGNPHPHAKAH